MLRIKTTQNVLIQDEKKEGRSLFNLCLSLSSHFVILCLAPLRTSAPPPSEEFLLGKFKLPVLWVLNGYAREMTQCSLYSLLKVLLDYHSKASFAIVPPGLPPTPRARTGH